MIGPEYNQGRTGRALLERALERLEQTTGVRVRKTTWNPLRQDGGAEARVEFEPPLAPHWVETKGELTPARLGLVLAAMERLPRPNLLVTPYVAQPMAKRLRDAGVQFLDAEGNAYLDQEAPRVLIWVVGNRPLKPGVGERPIRMLRAAGLRVIFPLLCLPERSLEQTTYRELANWGGVALGTVAKTLEELEHQGYLRKAKDRWVLEKKVKLMEAWIDAYPRELRPRLNPRRFRTDRTEWWDAADWDRWGAWLGGEPAAAVMTKHLRPVLATMYLAGGLPEVAKALRLAKDDEGTVEVLQKFWFFDWEGPQQPRLVPPLLVYADLVATGDARNLEAAALIKERYLG